MKIFIELLCILLGTCITLLIGIYIAIKTSDNNKNHTDLGL